MTLSYNFTPRGYDTTYTKCIWVQVVDLLRWHKNSYSSVVKKKRSPHKKQLSPKAKTDSDIGKWTKNWRRKKTEVTKIIQLKQMGWQGQCWVNLYGLCSCQVPRFYLCQAVFTLLSSNSSSGSQETFKVTICLWNHFQRNKTHLAHTQKYPRFSIMIISLWHCQVSFTESSVTVKTILQHQIKR